MDFRGHIVEDPRATFDSTTSKSSRDSILAAVPRLSMKHLSHNHCDRPPRHSSFVNRPEQEIKTGVGNRWTFTENHQEFNQCNTRRAFKKSIFGFNARHQTSSRYFLPLCSKDRSRSLHWSLCTWSPPLSLSFFTPLLLLIFFQFRFVASKRDTLFHIAPMKLIDEQHLSHRRLPSLSDIFVRCRRTVDVKNCYTHAAFRF